MPVFVHAHDIPPSIKTLEIGPAKTGKTIDFFYYPGARAAFSMDSGMLPYRDRFDFYMNPVSEMDELLKNVEFLLKDPEGRKELSAFKSICFDGLTKAWHDAIAELETESGGQIAFSKQKDLKSPWKRLNSMIKDLGNLNINVHATAHTKIDWEIPKDGGAPKAKGIKADFDQRLWEPFDLVIYRDKEEERDANGRLVRVHYNALVLASRFAHLQVGQLIRDWNPEVEIPRLFEVMSRRPGQTSGQGQGLVGGANYAAPTDIQKAEIERICRAYGSKRNGGVIDDSLAEEAVRILRGQGTQAQAESLLEKLRAIEQQALAQRTQETVSPNAAA